jgi:pyrroloquinoline quinone biosynthesis protein D
VPDEKKPAALDPKSVPVLPRGVRLKVDEVRERTVLLGPERTIDLDPVAAAIAGAVDGKRSLDEILDHLCNVYNAPREEIEADVTAFLLELADRRLLEIKP